MHVVGDVTTRTAGQHARAAVVRLRLRALLTLGVLAVATAALGRVFGLQDLRFLFAELALLASMFVISRYVLPLVDRLRGSSSIASSLSVSASVTLRGYTQKETSDTRSWRSECRRFRRSLRP